jgi:hypothetical protein
MRTRLRTSLVLVLATAGCTGSVATPPTAAATAATTAPAATPLAPLKDGVELEAIAPAGLARQSLDVDPFKAEARLVFQNEGSPVSVHLTVAVHDTAAAAAAAVAESARHVTGSLVSSGDLGIQADLGLGAALASGNVTYLRLARNNLSCVARLLPPTAADDSPLRAVVQAWLHAVDAEKPGAPSPPRIRSVSLAQEARAGKPAGLTLDVDPAGPAPVFLAYQASDGASVVASKLGPVLYAGKAGVFTVRVAAASSRLSSSVTESQVTVGN